MSAVHEALVAVLRDVDHVAKRDRNTHQKVKPWSRLPFWQRVAVTDSIDDCWEWLGAFQSAGYGYLSGRLAHRTAYELAVGSIPDGLTIDHLCRNRACCNPGHMEPVTRAENARRGEKNRIVRSGRPRPELTSRTHCANGHEFTPENTRRDGNARRCRECQRIRSAEFRRRKART